MTTYYHGTTTQMEPGDQLTPAGGAANGHRDHLSHGHVFATMHLGLARQYGNGTPGAARQLGYIYEVEPTGQLEQDPADVAGSYRTRFALRVVRLVEIRTADDRWRPACGIHKVHFAWGCVA